MDSSPAQAAKSCAPKPSLVPRCTKREDELAIQTRARDSASNADADRYQDVIAMFRARAGGRVAYILERIREWRAESELRNAHREAREEEERLQRRWAWIGRGFVLSDYESSDDEDEDEWELLQISSEMYF
ncbi:hypothetical protein DPV78_003133 [Talaromyces pinophilus]|nr:hypothetical protein DPV78_003133 [Talaromyces pinophilus]